MKALLWLNSTPPSSTLVEELVESAELLVGVDGGADLASNMGFQVDLILGDMDSLGGVYSEAEYVSLKDQNSSDLTKSILYLSERGYDEVDVVGIEGGEVAHQLGIMGSLAEAPMQVSIKLHTDDSLILRVCPSEAPKEVEVNIGDIFSIFALTNCDSISVSGGKWTFADESLSLSTKGLHNVADSSKLSIDTDGVIILILNR